MKKAQKKFSIHPVSFFVWIWLLLVLGFLPAICYILAISIHELGHYLTAKKLGYKLSSFSFSPYGVSLSYYGQNLDIKDEVLIALAGPLSNLFSAFMVVGVWWIFPAFYVFSSHFVLISVCLALVNFLPAFPLDGGRIFVCASSNFFPEKISKKLTILFNLILSFCAFVSFIAFCFINFNPTYFLFAFFLIVGALDLNFSTKYEKINVFTKNFRNFVRPTTVCVNPQTTLGEIIKKMQSSRTYIFFLILDNGRVVSLSEKMIVNLSLKFPFNQQLGDIFR